MQRRATASRLWHILQVAMAALIGGGFIAEKCAEGATIRLSASLTGEQEVPAVVTDALGLARLEYDQTTQRLDISMLIEGLVLEDLIPSTGQLQLHGPANSGELGEVLIDLGVWGEFQQFREVLSFVGTAIPIAAEVEPLLVSGLTYLNVYALSQPEGEIRGQVRGVPTPEPLAPDVWGAWLGIFLIARRAQVSGVSRRSFVSVSHR